VNLVEGVSEEVLHVAGGELEAGGGRRVEAVHVIQLDRVESLPGAHADALAEHGLERVQLAEIHATGAGDCFNAGLIVGLLKGLALPQAAALGCAVGALSTSAPGGTAGSPDMAVAAELAQGASVISYPE
jgi:hypothetical protein